MVVVGNYSLRLVNAQTKEAFMEHKGPDGKTYAEVEPKVDYFMEIEIVGGDYELKMFRFRVDGKALGRRSCISRFSGKSFVGLVSRENGIRTKRALSFQQPKFADSPNTTASSEFMGHIKIYISDVIYAGISERRDFSKTSFSPTSVALSLSLDQSKKVLRTGEGSHSESNRTSKVHSSYRCGKHLGSVTLHYCTTLGLIYAGVLPKPKDFWALPRKSNPWKPPSSSAASSDTTSTTKVIYVQPKRIKREATVENGVVVIPQSEHDLFDFSTLSDDETPRVRN